MYTTFSNITSTSFTVNFGDTPSDASQVELQYSTRPDFEWVISPILITSSMTSMTLLGLNQAQRYYVQLRPVYSNGTRGPWGPKGAIYTPVSALRSLTPASVMIEPAIIVPPEPLLDWYADDEVAGHPVKALGRDDPGSAWWSERNNGMYAFEVAVSGAPINTVALLETNASEACTITVKAGYGPTNVRAPNPPYQFTAPFRPSQGLPGRRAYHSLVRLPVDVQLPYWRIEIVGPVPGDLLVATYAVLGFAHTTRNFAADSKNEALLDYGSLDRDRSGNPSRVMGHRGRQVDFEIVNLTEAQYESAFEQLRWRLGTTEPALVVPNTKPGVFLHDRILYGTMSAGRATNTFSPRFSQQFSVNSLI